MPTTINPVERASTHTHRIRNPVERANTHTHRIMRIPIPMGLCEYPYPWDYASQKHGGTTCDTQNHRVGNPVGLAIPRSIARSRNREPTTHREVSSR